jgi:hypothetical protein
MPSVTFYSLLLNVVMLSVMGQVSLAVVSAGIHKVTKY